MIRMDGLKAVEKIEEKEEVPMTPKEEFMEKYKDIEMTPAIIEGRCTAKATSAMDRMLRRESLTAKLSEAIEKKSVEVDTPVAVPRVEVTIKTTEKNPEKPSEEALPESIQKAPFEASEVASTSSEAISRVVSSIKINGIPVSQSSSEPTSPSNAPVKISIKRRDSSLERKNSSTSKKKVKPELTIDVNAINERMKLEELEASEGSSMMTQSAIERRSAEPPTAQLGFDDDRKERAKSEAADDDIKGRRKRRDPTRTLENLKTSLTLAKKMESPATEPVMPSDASEKSKANTLRPLIVPLLLVTEPSNPNTPLCTTPDAASVSICLWNGHLKNEEEGEDEDVDEEEEEYSSGEWTEAEDEDEEEYASDCEFSVSQTFSLKDHMPLGDLFPIVPSSSTSSARVSDFGGETFLTEEMKEESRGRVDSLFANPPPTFTCSVSYDGQTSWGSDEVHSIEDDEDEEEYEDVDDYKVLPIARPGSSSLGAYQSPTCLTSDEEYDGQTYRDNVEVGFTMKLVDKAAFRDSDEEDEEFIFFRASESFRKAFFLCTRPYSDEEYWEDEEEEEEEYEDEDVYEEYEEEYDEEVDEEVEEFDDDSQLVTVMEKSPSPVSFSISHSIATEVAESDSDDDAMHSCMSQLEDLPVRVHKTLIPHMLDPVEEHVEEAMVGELPDEELLALDVMDVENDMGTKSF
ncbi:unnamed protein product [Caenorhabditis auriculariae]|uniref:Uncharacterized protein n=1 Tax=Caenorhabditis auriculariae TaxID=2777116 RepID=A0A8S1HW15_9PELO|nr:unnamed protein product [Caenorhabditis auriculariae]